MSNYSIGISGLRAAQRALDIIGNNIANAATEGYHRQRIELAPAYAHQQGEMLIGGGVKVEGVTRLIDHFLEQEMLRQTSLLEQVGSELGVLQSVENTLGEFSSEEGGLNEAIDKFFGSLKALSLHPDGAIWQNQVVSDAESMVSRFRILGEFLVGLETQIRLEADNVTESINTLCGRIAELNGDIQRVEIGGGSANNLRDQRDQLIADLSELVGVQVQSREYGVSDVTAAEIPVVADTSATELEVGFTLEGLMGISVAGSSNYITAVQGGKLGALLSLRNELIADLHGSLDSLASALVEQINEYHLQGVGSEGSFTGLTGWAIAWDDLADFDPPVSDGKIYVRVTNTSTGEITRHEIDVDASTGSLTGIAADISLIDGLTASVVSSKLSIWSDPDYEFDFLPCVLPTPTASNLTGASPPSVAVSGIYEGADNQTFTFSVSGTGAVGNGTLQLSVTNAGAEVVSVLDIGFGYAAGDFLEVGNGITVSLGLGDVVDGDTFEVDAFGDTDTSGVLSAVGINTLFSGKTASDIAVCPEIVAAPSRVATSLGPEMTDNANVIRMGALQDVALSGLNSLSCGEFYRRLVTDVGQQISLRKMRQENVEAMVQNLLTQRSERSGVDINEQAAELLVFEQMFQATAKYIGTLQSSLASLMQII
ncbi:MAG: flagellar hook-associated protein FlgK [Phycisphaerales bacterium]|nr:MAG: flagellar hook-associated protein FlgK [Phycisphaerales bacterium]